MSKRALLFLFLVSIRAWGQSADPLTTPTTEVPAEASAENPNGVAKKSPRDLGKAQVGDKSFMGDPDPLDVLEPKKQNNLSIDNGEPVFEDITDILDEKSKKTDAKKDPTTKDVLVPGIVKDLEKEKTKANEKSSSKDILSEDFQPPAEPPPPEVVHEESGVVDLSKPTELPKKKVAKKKTKSSKKKIAKKVSAPQKIDKSIEPPSLAGNDPDFAREERYHRYYKRGAEKPTDENVWGSLTEGRRSMVYEVQKGDTLSEISETLFGDPQFWPKVWSLNSKVILNPHIISPREPIRFFPGTVEAAPAFQIGGEVKASETASGEAVPEAHQPKELKVDPSDEAAVPPPQKRAGLVKPLPEIFDRPLNVRKAEINPKIEFDNIINRKPSGADLYLPYMVSADEILAAGKIDSVQDGRTVVADLQECVVEMRTSAAVGDVFYVVRRSQGENGFYDESYVAEILGQLRILYPVNSELHLYKAVVDKSIGQITLGSLLLPGSLPTFNVNTRSQAPAVEAKVAAGAYHDTSKIIGTNSFFFIDAGASQGLQVGQEISIYENFELRTGDERVKTNHKKIGRAQVVQVSEKLATAYLLESTTEVMPGDLVRR